MTTKTVSYLTEDGEEVEVDLPAKNEVCDRCEGHGTHLNPSIGEYGYSREEFEESFDEEEREEYFKRGGRYDVICEVCHGKNVVLLIDEEWIDKNGSLEEKTALEAYNEKLEEDAAYERECAAERRMGA